MGSFFYYAYLNFSQIVAKTEARHALSRQNTKLEVVKIPAKEFDTQKDEIWHNGHLYDVASYHTVADTVFVSVLRDETEEVVVSIITEHFSTNNNTSFKVGDPHFSSKHGYSPNDVKSLCERITILPVAFTTVSRLFATHYIAHDLKRSFAIEIPPPQV